MAASSLHTPHSMFCHRRTGFHTRPTDRASTGVSESLSGQTHSGDTDNLRTRPAVHRDNDHPDFATHTADNCKKHPPRCVALAVHQRRRPAKHLGTAMNSRHGPRGGSCCAARAPATAGQFQTSAGHNTAMAVLATRNTQLAPVSHTLAPR